MERGLDARAEVQLQATQTRAREQRPLAFRHVVLEVVLELLSQPSRARVADVLRDARRLERRLPRGRERGARRRRLQQSQGPEAEHENERARKTTTPAWREDYFFLFVVGRPALLSSHTES